MAGSKIDMSQFKKRLEAAIREVESPESMAAIGKDVAERIRKRTRLGRGVSETNGEASPLKPLSPKYKELRKETKLSPQTSPGKSNLTRTGQLLDGLKVISTKIGIAIIGWSSQRNREVAANVSGTRPFLNLSKPEMNAVVRMFRERIQNALRKKV